jgi:hypothetical protein
MGNLLNDLNILQKLIFISGKHTEDKLERRGRNLQALLLVRIHAGKLWEAWKLLKRDFFGAKLSQQYESRLDPLAKNGLSELKKYFSRKNLIFTVRNDFAFHYSSADSIEKQVDATRKEETFELLLAEEHGNCLYSMSDVVLNFSLLNAVDPSDPQRAIEKILDEVCTITKHFLDFLGETSWKQRGEQRIENHSKSQSLGSGSGSGKSSETPFNRRLTRAAKDL